MRFTKQIVIQNIDTAVCTLGVGESSQIPKEEFIRIDKNTVMKFARVCKVFQSHWYNLIWRRLRVLGYYINHKKVYRLMCDYHLLSQARKKKGRKFVQFRRVLPEGPLRVLEMDIQYIWVKGLARYCYVMTVLDTFTRYVLDWAVGLTMRQEQVLRLWARIIVHYLQPQNLLERKIELEVRNDNGKQFSSIMIQSYFEENHLNQVFTHPYSPEENGMSRAFIRH